MPSKKRKYKVDLVIPVYNEAGVIEKVHAQIRGVVDALPHEFRFIYVNDGSEDGTEESLQSVRQVDRRVTALSLSTNFGHQAALTAGLDHATGDIVISMDGDGQHPPEMIPQMIELIAQGYDIVQGQRAEEARQSFFKKFHPIFSTNSSTR
ncbi:MAG: glycosyltransferase family 2 protein [Anaerolineales bacterium]